ncbi:MAG: DUF2911 domain-containing protein [Rhodothermales bacterium]|nr:DUF2911 domain-containing protein [Rhodothermales bacterium]
MFRLNLFIIAAAMLMLVGSADAQDREKSPRGKAATQIGNAWIEVDYSRPILRGRRAIFGENQADTGVYAGAPVWRFGANTSTRLMTEIPLMFGDSLVEPGEYSLFAEIAEGDWTLIVSSHKAQKRYQEGDGLWGSYGYDSAKDVARVPLNIVKMDSSVDQFTIGFMNVTDAGGSLAFWWDNTMGSAAFQVAQ